MFKINTTLREAKEPQCGGGDNKSTEQMLMELRGRRDYFWLGTQTGFMCLEWGF